MFRQSSFLIAIFVLLTPNLFCNGQYLFGPLASPTKQSFARGKPNSILSLDEGNFDETFAVVDFQYHNYAFKTVIDINWRLENWRSQIVTDCHFSLANWATNITASSLRRLRGRYNDKAVLLLESDVHPGVFVMDFLTCYVTFLGSRNARWAPTMVPTDDGGLYLFVLSPEFCKDVDGYACMIKYNSNLQMVGRPKPFPPGWLWRNLHVVPLRNGNLLVRGVNDDTYSAVLVNSSTGKSTNLTALETEHVMPDTVYSGLSSCWVNDPKNDSIVSCTQFDDWGRLIFTNRAKFGAAVKPLALKELRDGKLFVLVAKTLVRRKGKRWDLRWAIISRFDDVVGSYTLRFNCTSYHMTDLVVRDVWQWGERKNVGYACENRDRYVYDVVSF